MFEFHRLYRSSWEKRTLAHARRSIAAAILAVALAATVAAAAITIDVLQLVAVELAQNALLSLKHRVGTACDPGIANCRHPILGKK
jgi:hypothetical protein